MRKILSLAALITTALFIVTSPALAKDRRGLFETEEEAAPQPNPWQGIISGLIGCVDPGEVPPSIYWDQDELGHVFVCRPLQRGDDMFGFPINGDRRGNGFIHEVITNGFERLFLYCEYQAPGFNASVGLRPGGACLNLSVPQPPIEGISDLEATLCCEEDESGQVCVGGSACCQIGNANRLCLTAPATGDVVFRCDYDINDPGLTDPGNPGLNINTSCTFFKDQDPLLQISIPVQTFPGPLQGVITVGGGLQYQGNQCNMQGIFEFRDCRGNYVEFNVINLGSNSTSVGFGTGWRF